MMYLPHQRHSSIMRDGESLNQKKSWPLSSALRPFCSAKPAVVGRYLQKILTNIMNCKIKCWILTFFGVIILSSCSRNDTSDLLVGTWISDNSDMVVFEEDGTCSAPFTYNASWVESADHYALTEDGTLIFSSEGGHANDSYEKGITRVLKK